MPAVCPLPLAQRGHKAQGGKANANVAQHACLFCLERMPEVYIPGRERVGQREKRRRERRGIGERRE